MLHYIESRTLFSRHYLCSHCRGIYCGENGHIVECARPAEHVFLWEGAPVITQRAPGAVIPGPMSKGMV
jgi:hypothetical protein